MSERSDGCVLSVHPLCLLALVSKRLPRPNNNPPLTDGVSGDPERQRWFPGSSLTSLLFWFAACCLFVLSVDAGFVADAAAPPGACVSPTIV